MSEEIKREESELGVEEFTTTASDEPGARSITLTYNFGGSLEESVEKFGADVVHGRFVKAAKIDLQAFIRRLMNAKNPVSDEEIRARVEEWKPGVRVPRAPSEDKLSKLINQISKLPAEKRKEFIEKLMGAGE